MADQLNERINLLLMHEAKGDIKPEHMAELSSYRASGVKRAGNSPTASPGATSPKSNGSTTATTKYLLDSMKGATHVYSQAALLKEFKQLVEETRPAGGILGSVKNAISGAFGNAGLERMDMLSKAFSKGARTVGEGSTSDYDAKMQVLMVGGADRTYDANMAYVKAAEDAGNMVVARHRFVDRYAKINNNSLDGADAAYGRWAAEGFRDPGKKPRPAPPSTRNANAGYKIEMVK